MTAQPRDLRPCDCCTHRYEKRDDHARKEGSRKIRRLKLARQDEFARFGTSSQREWLDVTLTPLRGEWITDVLQTVKSGKEATVYFCAAHPSTGVDLLAAKVYRPYVSRAIKDDAIYREGQSVRDRGYRRAIQRGSRLGRQPHWKEIERNAILVA